MHTRSFRILTVLALALIASPGAAQIKGHGGIEVTGPRPLHQRVMETDVIAIARVDEVTLGRLGLTRLEVVAGDVSETFEVKRAPSRPPPLVGGERVVLLLRGARSPYVLVDRPDEIIVPRDRASVERWQRELGALREAIRSPEAIARVYARWLAATDPGLRRAAVRGLGDPGIPISVDVARELADTAVNGAEADLRRDAAITLARGAQGRDALFDALVESPDADPQVVLVALRATALVSPDRARVLVLAALAHPRAAVRRQAVRQGAGVGAAEVQTEIDRMSREDPDEAVRELTGRSAAVSAGR